MIAKPATDLCWKCQNNNNQIFKSVNRNEEEKIALVTEQLRHLDTADKERKYYKAQCDVAKEDIETNFPNYVMFNKYPPCSFEGTTHISWDYAQQLHYLSDPFQPGPMYFKAARKCGVFGVCNDALNFQVNYLIDEIVNTGKGANGTISYVHHYLEKYGIGATCLLIHADNCVGKINFI